MTQEQVNQLLQLQKLYESGILSQEEFATEKAKILNADGGSNQTRKSQNSKVSNFDLKKIKKPLLLFLMGMVSVAIVFFVISQLKTAQNSEIVLDKDSIAFEISDEVFEDKFERLWVIGTTRDYTENDFLDWSKEDLKILRNYFFAKNNFIFNSNELKTYFSKYSWYQPLYNDVGDMFSDLQTNNVQFIKKLEGLSNYYQK